MHRDADIVEVHATVEDGVHTTWTGDAHRHAHGRPSGYGLTERRGIAVMERRWRVSMAQDGSIVLHLGTGDPLDELSIAGTIYQTAADAGGELRRCDARAPSPWP